MAAKESFRTGRRELQPGRIPRRCRRPFHRRRPDPPTWDRYQPADPGVQSSGIIVSARLKGRRRQVAALLPAVTAWAASRTDVVGLILVGSYARDCPRIGSDVDLILITTHPDRYLEHDDWLTELVPGGRLIRAKRWGAVSERRLRLRTGLHVELNVADQTWADLPLDPGTQRVLDGGGRPLHDPNNILRDALAAEGQAGPGRRLGRRQ
jgi:predicted nucleotidyltransferase